MSDNTKIEWADATWNVITGCSIKSPGCRNCYAMKLAGTRLRNHPSRAGLTTMSDAGPVWNGKACALALAEIECIDRAAAAKREDHEAPPAR